MSKLLNDKALADVTFAVDGQRFYAYHGVLAAWSFYFCGLFKSGKGMNEGGGSAAGQDIVIDGVSAGAFRALLRFLYPHHLHEEEHCGEGLKVGEMARVAARFQAVMLYNHCVQKFREGLNVDNVVVRLVLAHDSGLAALEETSMSFFRANAKAFWVRLLAAAFCIFWSLNHTLAPEHLDKGASLRSLCTERIKL